MRIRDAAPPGILPGDDFDHGQCPMRTIFLTLATLASGLVATAPATGAEPDTINLEFDGGAVLVLCTAPNPDSEEHAKVFADSFPKLIENMQIHANEGDLVRAHYLGRLKDGFFIVVGGENIEDARQNSAKLEEDFNAIISASIEAAGFESRPNVEASETCETTEIGPVAVLPMR